MPGGNSHQRKMAKKNTGRPKKKGEPFSGGTPDAFFAAKVQRGEGAVDIQLMSSLQEYFQGSYWGAREANEMPWAEALWAIRDKFGPHFADQVAADCLASVDERQFEMA